MDKLTLTSKIVLNDNTSIPKLGFGVYQSPPGEGTSKAVKEALSVGYRHIDTAAIYGNESDVGQGVRESGVPRKDIYVTTKLWNSNQGYDSARRGFDESFSRLDLDYIDLYLLHWPVQGKRLDSWRALVELKKEGRVKSIGVSNFTVRHLQELLDNTAVVPVINQIEFSPFLYQKEILSFCTKHKIVVEAYSPLTRGEKLSDKTLGVIAKKHGKTPAQVLIRWALQKGTVPLPKSNTPSRIKENAQVFDFELTGSEVSTLDNLNIDHHAAWDPTNAP